MLLKAPGDENVAGVFYRGHGMFLLSIRSVNINAPPSITFQGKSVSVANPIQGIIQSPTGATVSLDEDVVEVPIFLLIDLGETPMLAIRDTPAIKVSWVEP